MTCCLYLSVALVSEQLCLCDSLCPSPVPYSAPCTLLTSHLLCVVPGPHWVGQWLSTRGPPHRETPVCLSAVCHCRDQVGLDHFFQAPSVIRSASFGSWSVKKGKGMKKFVSGLSLPFFLSTLSFFHSALCAPFSLSLLFSLSALLSFYHLFPSIDLSSLSLSLSVILPLPPLAKVCSIRSAAGA